MSSSCARVGVCVRVYIDCTYEREYIHEKGTRRTLLIL